MAVAPTRARGTGSRRATQTCPYCDQPLANEEAIERLAESEREVERRLDEAVAARAKTLAQQLVAKAKADAEVEIRKLKQEQAAAVRAAKQEAQEDADRRAAQKSRTEMRKLTRTIESLREQNEEQARKIERLTSEERGEFNEEELVARLRAAFPDDRIERVKRGQTGADILHEVIVRGDGDALSAGLIAYECKDTLHWQNAFVEQAKKAGRTHGTTFVVVVTHAFPRGEKPFCVRDGVLVVAPPRLVDLAHVMRRMVVEVHRAALTAQGKAAKTEELYEYLSGAEFRQAFDALGKHGEALGALLAKERTWHEQTWAKRRSHYDDLASRTAAIDGRIRTIIEKPRAKADGKVVELRARS